MKRIVPILTAVCLLVFVCSVATAESVTNMHYVWMNWVGEYTGQVDSNNIPFGYGLFVSTTPQDGENWHYIGTWENGIPEGEGAVYFENGNMQKGTFSKGELLNGLVYNVTGLSAVPVKMEKTIVETEALYIGNKKSLRFHVPSCRSVTQMKDKNKVEFHSREEAIERGYIPCGDCNP
jgi:hypothetical protein